MRPMGIVIGGLVLSCIAWSACLRAQVPKAEEDPESPAVIVRPVRVDILSLQVSKLPRDQFGHGFKPGTNEKVMAWLANSGTAIDLRIKLDRPTGRFQEQASRLVRFADDRGGDLTKLPYGQEVNTLFNENKPIFVKPGPGADEVEVILRGYGTPAAGTTKLWVHADLAFLSVSDERTAQRKGLEPTPGTEATIGPLRIHFMDPKDVPAPGPLRFGPFGRRPPAPAVQPGKMRVAIAYERFEKPIKSLTCLDPQGETLASLEGGTLSSVQGGIVTFAIPELPRVTLKVVYFEKSETVTVPIRLETGLGF